MKLKKTVFTVVACMLAFVMTFTFAACNNDKKDDDDATVTAIALKATEEIEAGATSNVISEITYSDGSTKKVNDSSIEWLTSNAEVATVVRGVVTGVAKGTANITAKVGEVSSNTCAVTVIAGRVVTILKDGTAITALTVDKNDAPVSLTAKVTRDGAEVADQEIEWASADATKVAVDNSGKISVVSDSETPVAVTATIKGTSIKAEIAVTATWTGKDNYTFDASTYEQNKSPAGIWNYWGDKNYNWTNTNVGPVYVDPTYETNNTAKEGYQYIGANKVTAEFHVDDPTANVAAVQLFFRSAGEADEAKLLTNHNYEVTLKLNSNVAGVVSLNDYRVLPEHALSSVEVGEIASGEDANYEFDIVAGENTLTVQFRHGDTGAIYKNGIYDNIESAIQLCLGKLAGDHVVVSVYDIQYKDLGAAEKEWADNPENIEGGVAPVELPDLGDAVAINFALDAENKDDGETEAATAGQYTITAGADGKSSTVAYETYTTTYEALYVNVSENEAAQNGNMFAVTVKNNGTADARVRFDLNGTELTQPNNVKNCVLSYVTDNGGSGKVDEYGGTELTVKAGEEVTVYYTYSTENHGTLENIAIYFDTLWAGGTEENGWTGTNEKRSGNVTISNLTFAKVKTKQLVEGKTIEADYSTLPEGQIGTQEGIPEDQWAFWWVGDVSWDCGEVVTMDKSINADNKSVTATFAGGDNNWSVQLHYVSPEVVKGEIYKLKLTINSDTAYDISVNGKTVSLTVGSNDIEFQWTAGDYALDMSCAKTDSDEPITLVFSNLQWIELVYSDDAE